MPAFRLKAWKSRIKSSFLKLKRADAELTALPFFDGLPLCRGIFSFPLFGSFQNFTRLLKRNSVLKIVDDQRLVFKPDGNQKRSSFKFLVNSDDFSSDRNIQRF